jgi:hypothetical protein
MFKVKIRSSKKPTEPSSKLNLQKEAVSEAHSATTQKTVPSIVSAMRTSKTTKGKDITQILLNIT